MNLQLTGKRALVTGSSKGIGEAIARVLASEGAIVMVHGRNQEQTQRVATDIAALGGKSYAVTGDLLEDDAVEGMIGDVQRLVGAVDILVNNAGGSGPKETWEATQPDSWASAL